MASTTASKPKSQSFRLLDLPPEIQHVFYENILLPGPVPIQMISVEVPIPTPKLDWRRNGRQTAVDEDLGSHRTAVIELQRIYITDEGKRARYRLQKVFNLMQSCRLFYTGLKSVFYAALHPVAGFLTARLYVKTFPRSACPLKQMSPRSTQSISQRRLAALVESMPELESLSIELWTIQTSKSGEGAVLARWELRRLQRLLRASPILVMVCIVPNTGGYRGGSSFRNARLTSAKLDKEGQVSSQTSLHVPLLIRVEEIEINIADQLKSIH